MAQQPLTNRVTRDQLSAFLKDFRTIRQFEELFNAQDQLPAALILAEEALVTAGTADATATQAVDTIAALTDAIMAAALAPAPADAAPVGASYVVLSADNALGNERVLTAGANITLTDGGPGGTITIAASGGGGGGGGYPSALGYSR